MTRIIFLTLIIITIFYLLSKEGNVLSRLFKLFKGKTDRELDKAAVADPDAVYRQAIADEEAELFELDQLIREIKREEFAIGEEKESTAAKIAMTKTALDKAVREGNEEVGALAITEIDRLEAIHKELETRLETFKNEQASYMETRSAQAGQLDELRREALMNRNAIKANAVLQGIRDRKNNLGAGEDKNLTAVRKAAFDAKADMKTNAQISASSPTAQLEAFMKAGSGEAAKDRFAAMKAASATKTE